MQMPVAEAGAEQRRLPEVLIGHTVEIHLREEGCEAVAAARVGVAGRGSREARKLCKDCVHEAAVQDHLGPTESLDDESFRSCRKRKLVN